MPKTLTKSVFKAGVCSKLIPGGVTLPLTETVEGIHSRSKLMADLLSQEYTDRTQQTVARHFTESSHNIDFPVVSDHSSGLANWRDNTIRIEDMMGRLAYF